MAMAAPEHVPTALVFGKSGMGKSYLCNCLLYGDGYSEEGFAVEEEPVTDIKCEARYVERTDAPNKQQGSSKPGGPLKMIDTPGIPDPAGINTEKYYDDIVQAVENAEGLSAFVMVLTNTTDREHLRKDIETYRVLLTQFAELPVSKVVVCRVRPDKWATTEQQNKKMEITKKWVSDVMRKGGVEKALEVYIKEDDTMMSQYFDLRSLVTGLPWTPVNGWKMKRYAELMGSDQGSADPSTPTKATRTDGNTPTEAGPPTSQEGPAVPNTRAEAGTHTKTNAGTGLNIQIERGAVTEPDPQRPLCRQTEELQEKKRSLEEKRGKLDEDIATLKNQAKEAENTSLQMVLSVLLSMISFGYSANNQQKYREKIAAKEARKEDIEEELSHIAREMEGRQNYIGEQEH